jgi:predicted glutamine amidotransferase
MCELFGLSSRHPATVTLSLEELARHGGLTGPHKDGWGIAWYEDRDVRLIKESRPAAGSPWVRFVQRHPFESAMVISHIRKATQGGVATRNGQPFVRELGGAWHAFAHNGHLGEGPAAVPAPRFRPVGETDSERAFCQLLERLAPLWQGRAPPPLAARYGVVAAFAAELRPLGPANFLYADGDALFAHADRRTQADGSIAPPGLWSLGRHCPHGGRLDAPGVSIDAPQDEQAVRLVASVPLTDEAWEPLAPGTLLVLRGGGPVAPAPNPG